MTPCYLPRTEIPTENFLFPIQLEFVCQGLTTSPRFSVPLKHTSAPPEQRLYLLCQTQVSPTRDTLYPGQKLGGFFFFPHQIRTPTSPEPGTVL